jgi:hypothetical protein
MIRIQLSTGIVRINMHHFLLIVIVFLSIGCTKEVSENEIIGILKSSNHFPYTGAFIIPRASGYYLYQDSKELGYIHFVDKTYFEIGGIKDSSATEKIQDIASVFKEAKLAALYGHDSFTMFGLGNRKALIYVKTREFFTQENSSYYRDKISRQINEKWFVVEVE